MKVGIILIVLFSLNLWSGIVTILNTHNLWYLISIFVSVTAIAYGIRRMTPKRG